MSAATDFSSPFTGRYYRVTGSTPGMGAAVALTMAQCGAAGLIICGRSRDKGEQQARQLSELACKTFFVDTDVESVEDCRRVVAADQSGMMTGAVIDMEQSVMGCGDGSTPRPDAPLTLPGVDGAGQ